MSRHPWGSGTNAVLTIAKMLPLSAKDWQHPAQQRIGGTAKDENPRRRVPGPF